MTSKIEVPRESIELLEKLLRPSVNAPKICNGSWDEWESRCLIEADKLAALLAAPEAPRQEPVAWQLDVEGYKTVTLDNYQRALSEQEHFHGRGRSAVIHNLYRAPLSPYHSGGGAGVVGQVCKLGIYGKAYDMPETKRAYTYADQPGNVEAHKLGQAVNLAALSPGGDLIDQGLSLLRALSGEGFGVFEIDKVKELNQ